MLSAVLSKLVDAVTNRDSTGSTSFSFSSSSSSYYHYSDGTHTTSGGSRHATIRETDSFGRTTVRTASQNLGEPAVMETRRYDARGREIPSHDLPRNAPVRGQIIDVTEYDSEEEREMERDRVRTGRTDEKHRRNMEGRRSNRG